MPTDTLLFRLLQVLSLDVAERQGRTGIRNGDIRQGCHEAVRDLRQGVSPWLQPGEILRRLQDHISAAAKGGARQTMQGE